jgi:hypothetical protein
MDVEVRIDASDDASWAGGCWDRRCLSGRSPDQGARRLTAAQPARFTSRRQGNSAKINR